jgi:hypothetical protein
MPWGGGSYTKGNSATGGWTGDASLGIGIEAGRHDTQDNDFATGINQCLNKDGSNAATGDLNLGGFRPTNIVAGTAAAPAVCVGGDTNTGVFGPAADTWAVATNGSERVRVDSTGRVGIGTATPTSALQVTGAIDGSPDAEGVHIGMVGTTYACVELCGSTGGIIDFTSAGVDNKGRIIYTNSDNVMVFATNNAERMRIVSDGNVAIGTTSAGTARVYVKSSGNAATTYAQWWENSSGSGLGYVRSDGLFNTGLAAQSPYNATTATAANVVVDANGSLLRSTSSARYKTDIQPYTHGLAEVLVLAPKFYKGINDGNKQFAGLIAEDVDAAGLTEFVVYNDSGEPDALAYSNMVALAFKAIQELNAKVEALETRVAQLEEA